MILFVLKLAAAALIGYLLGNLSWGIILSKLFGNIDIRRHGSGNAGTTNVLRTLGWLPSALTLIGDVLKAWFAAWLGGKIAGDAGLMVGGACAVAGHNWPIFLGLRGGKGIASSLGVLLAFHPMIGLLLVIGQLAVVIITGYMSLASVINACLTPVWTIIFMRGHSNYWLYVLFSFILAALALYSHRANIRRLRSGEENRLDVKKIEFLKKKIQAHRGKKKKH